MFIFPTPGSSRVGRVTVTDHVARLSVAVDGTTYPAEEIGRGAAYEIFSMAEAAGFERDPRPAAPYPYHRFVHATEVTHVAGRQDQQDPREEQPDTPLTVPLSRAVGWSEVHGRTQTPHHAADPFVTALRGSATVRRGTRMAKILSPAQVGAHLHGRMPHGFCYRAYDIAHLRTPADLALLRTDGAEARDRTEVAFALRWRAVDPGDYDVPVGPRHHGLVTMPSHDRVGAPVLGTGFTPSGRHVIPEFITRDLADLPLPVSATIVAYTAAGEEAILYTHQPEQRGWLRMAGPRWRPVLASIPEVNPDQEYVQMGERRRSTYLAGTYQGQECEAIADPPDEFRVLAMTRAARYPVETMTRRTEYAMWRDAPCLVLGQEAGWLRLRLCRPDADAVARLGAQCYERAIYETWAPAGEVADRGYLDTPYRL
jgi:hypothetical protein